MRILSELRSRRAPMFEAVASDNLKDGANNSRSSKGKMHPDHSAALPNAKWYPEMSIYGHYRALVNCASLPNLPDIASSSPVSDHPFSAGYSVEDQKMIDIAAKLAGFEARKLGTGYSSEGENIHKASPTNHNSGKHPK